MSDLEKAYQALQSKQKGYTDLYRYYDGDQPLMYTNQRLEDIFQGLDTVFVENWCAVVVDSTKDRINLRAFQSTDTEVQKTLAPLVERLELLLEADDVHEAALVTGEAFLIVWPDEDGQPDAYFNDPRLCHVFYDPANPRQKRFAAKWWVEDDGTLRMTLYYPERLEYYATTKKAENVSLATAFQPLAPFEAPNPYGRVPVFHFRPQRRVVKSDLKSALPIQNGINKLLSDMMVAAEYGAFKQRYVISNGDTLGKLKNAPNQVWDLPAGDGVGQATQVGEFTPTDLANYLQAIESLAMTLSSITRIPKHYFMGQGGDPSGEALIAMESPLNKKAQDRIDRFLPVWRDAVAFLLQIGGYPVDPSDITPVFDRPETVQPKTQAEIRKINRESGMPLISTLRKEGWSPADLDQLQKDLDAEAAENAATLAQGFIESERHFNAGGE